MNALPGEQTWLRVEALAQLLGGLSAEAAAEQLAQLSTADESSTVLHLVRTWLDLPAPPPDLSAGQRVGGFVLLDKLGDGGMGIVWRARQDSVDRDVALKMIHPALVTPDLVERFEREIKILGRLEHPGIVRIIDAGVHATAGGRRIPFCVMDLVRGQPLRQWADGQRSDPGAILRLFAAVGAAVQRAHDEGVVHRDLKPENILVREDGQPVVLDFGVARIVGTGLEEALAGFIGTPQYAAPEQHLGRDHDFQSGEGVDVYSLAVVAFEALAGRRPFEFHRGTPMSEIRRAILEDPVPRITVVRPDLPEHVAEILAKALRRNPADRYYSMAALGRALARSAEAMDLPHPPEVVWRPVANLLIPGTQWCLDQRIGEGGAGEVWRGRHEELGTRRIFKFCETAETARTLRRELTLFRLLKERVGRNPHFVQLHEVSLDEPPYYLMMEDDDALDLLAWSSCQPGGLAALPVEVGIEIVAQTAEALQAAHEAGILHRDIKPANILLRATSSSDANQPAENGSESLHVLIADFGIGQLLTDKLPGGGTRLGFTHTVSDARQAVLAGSLPYMAPEVIAGGPASARSDVFSLGVVLWQLLVGDLTAALDPSDWAGRVADPLLRGDLLRCFAGSPERRWASAGEFATSLRSLQARREAAARHEADVRARERAAYRLGVVRAASVAVAVLALVGALGAYAWWQRNAALQSRGGMAVAQAASLGLTDPSAGRRDRGLRLLEIAGAGHAATDRSALRSAAASVFDLTDLVLRSPTNRPASSSPTGPQSRLSIPVVADESARALSHSGAIVAVARTLEDGYGTIDLIDANTGQRQQSITRQEFPRIPVAEPGLLIFEPGDRRLAVGGGATSRHVLVCSATNGDVLACFYHPSDPLACTWHPEQPWLAVACADGSVRLWNATTTSHRTIATRTDLVSANIPSQILEGHRGAVRHVCFSGDGKWLASLDELGYLRIHSVAGSRLASHLASRRDPRAVFVIETRLDHPDEIDSIAFSESVAIHRRNGVVETYQVASGACSEEMNLGSDVLGLEWDGVGAQLCAITLTDAHWVDAARVEPLLSDEGCNPVGIGWSGDRWLRVGAGALTPCLPIQMGPRLQLRTDPSVRLPALSNAQATVTAISMNGRGEAAVYQGRRILFFAGGRLAEDSLPTDGGVSTRFSTICWDDPGQLLGVLYQVGDRGQRLESWAITGTLPPHGAKLPPRELAAEEQLAPANDGLHFLIRGRRGVVRLNPATGIATVLNASIEARQFGLLTTDPSGRMVAMVVDRSRLQLLSLPEGIPYADLPFPAGAQITGLAWDRDGRQLAVAGSGGSLRIWRLGEWLDWLARHHLNAP